MAQFSFSHAGPVIRRAQFAAALLIAGVIAAPAAAQTAEREASPKDRSVMEATVYNGYLAMIRGTRKIAY